MPGQVTATPVPQGPIEPTAFEKDLEGRIAKAKADIETRTTDLNPKPDAAPAAPAPKVEVETPPAEMPSTEAPLTETAPGVETPPVTEPARETPPVTEPAPKTEVPEQRAEGDKFDWKGYRELQRENRRLKREAEERAKTPKTTAPGAEVETPPAQPLPNGEEDALGLRTMVTEATQPALERITQAEQRLAAERVQLEIQQSEAQFRQVHPDYDEAARALVLNEKKRYELSGDNLVTGEKLYNAALAAADRDPRAREMVDMIETRAEQQNISDLQAAAQVATDLWLQTQTNRVIEGARKRGISVAQAVWEQATEVLGYQPKAVTTTATQLPATTEAARPAESVAEKMRREARATAAGKSVSAAASASSVEQPPTAYNTLRDLNAFRDRDPVGYRAYIAQRTAKDPNWHRSLTA
jgi:hypothetical protein